MDNIVYTAMVEGCTFEDLKKLQEMFEQNSDPMQKAREHLQELCDNAYGKGTRVIMVSAQKAI